MNEKLIIPISIVIAGIVIAGAIVFTGSKNVPVAAPTAQQPSAQQPSGEVSKISKVDATDHVFGSRDADIFVIEYSDVECPFCKTYHDETLSRLKADYQGNDRVAFVFRHFPLDAPFTRELHPGATEKAIASECISSIAGDDKFFSFIAGLFADSSSNGMTGEALEVKLVELATSIGVDASAFKSCYAKNDGTPVAADFQNGSEGGVQGTPTVFLQDARTNQTFLAVPDYSTLKQAIEIYLQGN